MSLASLFDALPSNQDVIERSLRQALRNGAEWRCPFACGFHRWAETKGGMIRVASRHLREEHRIRLEVR